MKNLFRIDSLPSITIGRRDDNLTNEIRIDCASWIEKYPGLTTYRIEYVDPLKQKKIALKVEMEEAILTWTITSEDTAIEGEGRYQIIATGKNGEQKASREATLYVRSRIHGDGQEESVEYMKPLLDQVAENASRAEEAAKRAEEAAVGKVPFATSDTAGVVKVGEGLTVEEDGTLSVVGGSSPSDPSEPGTPGVPGEDGEDGGYYTPSVNEDGELTWTASKEDMPKVPSSNIKGEPGNPGAPGEDGKDGFSPTVEVIKQDGIATFTVTDKNGTSSIEIADGKDGKDGEDGEPGKSGVHVGSEEPTDPSVSVWIDPNGETNLPTASATVKGGVKVGNGLQMDGDVLSVEPEGVYETVAEITLEEDVAYYTWAQDVEYRKLLLRLEQPPVDGYESATSKASYVWLGDVIGTDTITGRIGELTHSMYNTYTSVLMECKNGRVFCKADTSRNNLYNNAASYVSSFLNNGMVERESINTLTIGNLSGTLYAGLKIRIEGVRADA